MSDTPSELPAATATADEFISLAELLALSLETRIGRIAEACEKAVAIQAASRDDITGLTVQVHRLADAFESIAAMFSCATESVTGADGVARCVIRTRDTVPGALASSDNRDG